MKVLQTKKDMFTKKSSVTVRPLIQPNQPQQVDVKNVVKSSSNIVPMEKGVGGWWSSGINDSADVNSAVDITANVSASISNTNMKIMETGESLFLYWLDAYEMDSTIYLFGKVYLFIYIYLPL